MPVISAIFSVIFALQRWGSPVAALNVPYFQLGRKRYCRAGKRAKIAARASRTGDMSANSVDAYWSPPGNLEKSSGPRRLEIRSGRPREVTCAACPKDRDRS
jgi:hypothetical protein